MNEQDKMEEWKEVEGFSGRYLISSCGQIKAVEKLVSSRYGERRVSEKILRQSINNKGYKRVSLRLKNKSFHFSVHRLVALSFHVSIQGKNHVNHKNGIKTDNNAVNLEWVTRSENQKHAADNGLLVPSWKRLDDIHFLTYATCLRKYSSRELKNLMSRQNFDLAKKGLLKTGVEKVLQAHMQDFPAPLGPRPRDALKEYRGEK